MSEGVHGQAAAFERGVFFSAGHVARSNSAGSSPSTRDNASALLMLVPLVPLLSRCTTSRDTPLASASVVWLKPRSRIALQNTSGNGLVAMRYVYNVIGRIRQTPFAI